MRNGQIPHPLQGATFCNNLFGEGEGACQQIAFDKVVKQRRQPQQIGSDRGARDNHVERRLQANETRQTLRATTAWEQTDLDFGQGNLGASDCHAEMATQ